MITLHLSANKPPQTKSEASAMKKPNDSEAVRRARVRKAAHPKLYRKDPKSHLLEKPYADHSAMLYVTSSITATKMPRRQTATTPARNNSSSASSNLMSHLAGINNKAWW
jgi:hypothetical protein